MNNKFSIDKKYGTLWDSTIVANHDIVHKDNTKYEIIPILLITNNPSKTTK